MSSTVCEVCGLEFANDPPKLDTWLGVVYAVFKKLHDEIKPHQKYYHYKQDICNYIDENWSTFCPDKKRTKTWNNTISAVITTHPNVFECNPQASGFWTLKKLGGGALLIKKGKPTKSKHADDDDEDGGEDGLGEGDPSYPSRRSDRIASSPTVGHKRTFSEIEDPVIADEFYPGHGTPKRIKSEIPAREGPTVPYSLRRRRKIPPYKYQLVGGMLREIGWNILKRPKPPPPQPIVLAPAPTAPLVSAAEIVPLSSSSSSIQLQANNNGTPTISPAVTEANFFSSVHSSMELPPVLSSIPSSVVMPLDSNPDNEDQEIDIEDVPPTQTVSTPTVATAESAGLPPTPSIATAPIIVQPMVDPYDPEVFFEPDEYGIPLPPGWYDRTLKRYPQARQIARAVHRAEHDKTLADEIPLPTWREADAAEPVAKVEADDAVAPEETTNNEGEPEEDDSDTKYFHMHTYYEALERRIKKWN